MKTYARPIFRTLVTAALVAAAGTAFARPDTRSMTCEQTQRLIIRSGAVVLTTGPHTYDRYVSGYGYCSRPEAPVRTYVRTKDYSDCPVYNCQRVDPPIFND